MTGLDEIIILGARERKTLRQLSGEGRIVLRRSRSQGPVAEGSREALWADVSQPNNPNATERFEISQAVYVRLLDKGVPEEVVSGTYMPDSEY